MMLEDEALVLRWQEFSRNIGSSSAVFRRESTFADLTLVVDGAQVQVHRFILASCSPLFLGMLRHLNHPHPVVFLRGVDHHHLLLILDFMYLGEVSVQQKELPAFLRTAEDLQVKGLIEKEDSTQEASTENSEVEKVTTELPDLFSQPLQITPKAEIQNIGTESNNKKQPGGRSCTAATSNKKKESKRASKRAVNNENSSNTKKKRKSEQMSKQSPHESTSNLEVGKDSTDFLEVSQEQVKAQGMIQNAIDTTESEIEQLEEGLTEDEMRRKMMVDDDQEEEEDEPSLLDATDSTISEVENMLKETRRLLREETGIGATKKPQINGDHAEQGVEVAGLDLPPTKKLLSQSLPSVTTGKVKSTRNQSNTTKKKPLKVKLVNTRHTSGDPNRPGTPLAQTLTSEATAVNIPSKVKTPCKAVDQSDKERAIIACLVTKLSSSHGWRCTICRAVFPSKSETEEHVGVSHVLGNLS